MATQGIAMEVVVRQAGRGVSHLARVGCSLVQETIGGIASLGSGGHRVPEGTMKIGRGTTRVPRVRVCVLGGRMKIGHGVRAVRENLNALDEHEVAGMMRGEMQEQAAEVWDLRHKVHRGLPRRRALTGMATPLRAR